MKKVIYIHGLGGSGNGSSSKNIKKLLGSEYEFSAKRRTNGIKSTSVTPQI